MNHLLELTVVLIAITTIVLIGCYWWDKHRDAKRKSVLITNLYDIDDGPVPRVDRVEDAGRLQ